MMHYGSSLMTDCDDDPMIVHNDDDDYDYDDDLPD